MGMASSMKKVRAYAPASIGNFAAGFDLLGAALAPLDGSWMGDIVEIAPAERLSFEIAGPFAPLLAGATKQNLVLRAYDLFREALEAKGLSCGPFAFRLEKRLPLNSGLGSSASSIVASLVGLQTLCGDPLNRRELLDLAGRAEGTYSGGAHLDNVAPSLLGGLQLVVPESEAGFSSRTLPWPEDLWVVVVHPEFELPTATSRAVLPSAFPRSETIGFAGNLAAFVHALHSGDRALLRRCLRDPLAEPYRADLVVGFRQAKLRAQELGAVGCSLSGSGPSVFAVAESPEGADAICEAMCEAFRSAGLQTESWICGLDVQGARIVP